MASTLLARFRRAIALVFLLTLLLGDSGESAFAHGAYHDLVAQLEDALASTPGDLDLRYQLALAHVEHGEWEAALHEVEHLTRLAPERFETRLISGKALAAAGLLGDALRDLDAYMEIHPGNQPGLVERARVRLRLGQSEAGCADYLAALTAPATPDIYIEAAEALRRLGRGEEALRCAEEGEKLSGGDPSVLLCAMECAKELGKVDEVVARLDRLAAVWPRPEIWMQQKAEYLAESGRANESHAAWVRLHDHLMSLPNLERAQPFLAGAMDASRRALGLDVPATVVAPPVSAAP